MAFGRKASVMFDILSMKIFLQCRIIFSRAQKNSRYLISSWLARINFVSFGIVRTCVGWYKVQIPTLLITCLNVASLVIFRFPYVELCTFPCKYVIKLILFIAMECHWCLFGSDYWLLSVSCVFCFLIGGFSIHPFYIKDCKSQMKALWVGISSR